MKRSIKKELNKETRDNINSFLQRYNSWQRKRALKEVIKIVKDREKQYETNTKVVEREYNR